MKTPHLDAIECSGGLEPDEELELPFSANNQHIFFLDRPVSLVSGTKERPDEETL